MPGSGNYRLQPIYVEDMAKICVQAGETEENKVIDAVGPQIFTFNELVSLIRRAVDRRTRIIHLPPTITLYLARLIGLWLRDVTLTRDEIRGLSSDLLVSKGTPKGKTSAGGLVDGKPGEHRGKICFRAEKTFCQCLTPRS